MNLIIDIGNSSVKLAYFEDGQLVEAYRHSHEILKQLSIGINHKEEIDRAIVSSVLPFDDVFEQSLKLLPFPVVRMSSHLQLPFTNLYTTPETLGTDRLAAVAGACAQQPGRNRLVIDAGTAITYDFVDASNHYRGGNISPGIDMRFKALHTFTGRLPLVGKEGERCAIGHSTETAIREGVLQGVKLEMEGQIAAYSLKYVDLLVFLTGGDEFLLCNNSKSSIFADNFLVLKGLNTILALNDE